MGKFSKDKGKRGEREVVQLLKSWGYEARRGQQFQGSPDSPDVISNFHDSHIEVKRTETLSVYKAVSQAHEDASNKQLPMVFHKRNGKEWLIIMEAETLNQLLERLMASEL